MARIDDLKNIRLEVALKAAERWNSREAERSGASRRYVERGPDSADTPERAALFRAREAIRRQRGLDFRVLTVAQERQIGPTLDFTSYAPDEGARLAGRPVARIVEMPGQGMIPRGFATGFLVSPSLLLTNHHVFPSLADAKGTGANFLYEYTSQGLQAGPIFEIDPDAFFVNDEALDFALVGVKRASGELNLDSFGFTGLIAARGKILVGHPISIIQYPSAGPKQYATTENKLLDVLETGFLQYTTDTMPGSSGSPAFNRSWELVALHHSGVPLVQNGKITAKNGQPWDENTMSEDDILWVANEGIRVSNIVQFLAGVILKDPDQGKTLSDLLKSTADPLRDETGAAPGMPQAASPIDLTGQGATIHVESATIYVNTGRPERAAAANGSIDVQEKKLRFDPDYRHRRGYHPQFLGAEVPFPKVEKTLEAKLVKERGKVLILDYHHFSLAMHEERRLQVWSAVNVNYNEAVKTKKPRSAFGTDTWVPDPRIPGELQIEDRDFYSPATKIDRGHIVRREDNAWGLTEEEIEYANSDTFHWTNCTPQHEAFNQERRNGLWGELEGHIKDQIGAVGNRACIFAGPILDKDDPGRDFGYGYIRYPLKFWKVFTCLSGEGLRSYGFVLDQSGPVNRLGIEAFETGRFRPYQVSLATITKLTGVVFDQVLHNADAFAAAGEGADERVEIDDLEKVRLGPVSGRSAREAVPAS